MTKPIRVQAHDRLDRIAEILRPQLGGVGDLLTLDPQDARFARVPIALLEGLVDLWAEVAAVEQRSLLGEEKERRDTIEVMETTLADLADLASGEDR